MRRGFDVSQEKLEFRIKTLWIGTRNAPLLWTICIYHVLHRLLDIQSMDWIRDHIVVFADDLYFK